MSRAVELVRSVMCLDLFLGRVEESVDCLELLAVDRAVLAGSCQPGFVVFECLGVWHGRVLEDDLGEDSPQGDLARLAAVEPGEQVFEVFLDEAHPAAGQRPRELPVLAEVQEVGEEVFGLEVALQVCHVGQLALDADDVRDEEAVRETDLDGRADDGGRGVEVEYLVADEQVVVGEGELGLYFLFALDVAAEEDCLGEGLLPVHP